MSQDLEVNIRGTYYYIKPFLGRKGFVLKTKILKIVGGAVGALSSSGEAQGEDASIEMMANIASAVLGSLDEASTLKLVEDLISEVYKSNMKINFDTEFCQNYVGLFELVVQVLKLNYSDVFQALGIDAIKSVRG